MEVWERAIAVRVVTSAKILGVSKALPKRLVHSLNERCDRKNNGVRITPRFLPGQMEGFLLTEDRV